MPPDPRLPAGYFVVIDADGAEVESSRRKVDEGMPREDTLRIRRDLEAKIGPGCYVEFKET